MKKFPQLEQRLCDIEKKLEELSKDEKIYNYTADDARLSGMSNN